MNNAVYTFFNGRNHLTGFRCYECNRVRPSMWGETCNECREKERRHQELLDAIRPEGKRESNDESR